MRIGVDRLDRMIRDLLDVERARSGDTIVTERVEGDAAAMIDEILRAATIVSGDRLETEVEHPMPGRFDRDALERILENLIGNAFKYGAENGRVRVTAHLAGQRGSDTRERAGWGIGLPVVRGLCDALGGKLEIESSAEAGTTFRVLLPAS